MFKLRSLAGVLLVVTVLFAQAGTVFAAPVAQEATTTTITGSITHIETQLDSNSETVVVVTLEGYQPITLTAQEASDNGLYDLNTQELLVQDGDTVELTVDPAVVIPDEEVPEEAVNPVAAILASFFGVDPSVINQYHEDGFGFGVIAQALWIAQGLEEDNADITAGLILHAKRDKDFSAFVLPDGSTPTNWGQFKNAALGKDKKNLGIIVSGHAENGDDETTAESSLVQQHGNGKNKNKIHGNGNGHGNPNRP